MSQNLPVPQPPQAPQESADIFGKDNPRSVYNLVTDRVRDGIDKLQEKFPDLLGLPEKSLRHSLQKLNAQPDITDNQLRLKFWQAYEECQARGHKAMSIQNVCAGICDREWFHEKYLQNPMKLAWILCVPTNYVVVIDEALQYGIMRMRDILEMNVIDPVTGKVNNSLLQMQLKIVTMLDARKHGAVVQRSMQVVAHTSDKQVAAAMVGNTTETSAVKMAKLNARIAQLEMLERKALHLTEPKKKVEIITDVEET